MPTPERIALIGNEVAIRWQDSSEDYFPASFLRRHSPSAENQGERDLLGREITGAQPADGTGVGVAGWQMIGGYAIQFQFTDGHSTGLFTYDYLKRLAALLAELREGA